MAQRPFFGARQGVTQPARTMPEQDEVGKGASGANSNVPIRRQIAALERTTDPQRTPGAPDSLESFLRRIRLS
jgi:hypothetical protein